MRMIPLVLLLIPYAALSADIYRCVDDKGRQTYSQRPCGDNAEKITVTGPDQAGSVAPDSQAIDRMEASNQVRVIDRVVRDKLDEIDRLNDRMSRELAALQAKRRYANNNLAGAQWEQSLATEMQAVTQKYKVKIDLLQSDIERLRARRDRLEGM